MSIFSIFKPATKTPEQKLRETKAMLLQWIAESEAELVDCTDELWAMSERDNIASWEAQIELVDYLLLYPEQRTAQGLENLLREKFRVYDKLDASLANLPTFDEDEDELDYATMSAQERIQRKASRRYHDRQFTLQHQIDLLARFAGVSARRVHDVIYIMCAHYTPVEDRPSRQNELAADYYPLVREWMDGKRGPLKTLDIPPKFSEWMSEYSSPFPTLVQSVEAS